MFKESAEQFITESLGKMSEPDKRQVARFIEMQAAYKRARIMKGSVKKNEIPMSEVVDVIRKVRSQNAAKKK